MKQYIVCQFHDGGSPVIDGARIYVIATYDDQHKAVARAREEARNHGRPFGVLESAVVVRPQERPVTVTVIS